MKFSLLSAVALAVAPAAVSAVCCIGAAPPPILCGLVAPGDGGAVDMKNAIFNADVYVPEGAKNVLTNSTFGTLAVCCCQADNPLACRARCGV